MPDSHPNVQCPACGAAPGSPCLAARTPLVDASPMVEDPHEMPAMYVRSPHLKRLELALRDASLKATLLEQYPPLRRLSFKTTPTSDP